MPSWNKNLSKSEIDKPANVAVSLIALADLVFLVTGFVVFLAASLSYKIRDLNHLVPFLMYFGIWVTPVFFTKTVLPKPIDMIWYFNPMAAVVEGWRWCLFADWPFDWHFAPALGSIVLLFAFGFYLYSQAESKFSDFV